MANQRRFLAQRLNTAGQILGGLSHINFDGTYSNVIVSTSDGAIGAQDVNRTGLRVDVTLETTDVTKVFAILAGAGVSTTWAERESASAAGLYTIFAIDENNCKVVWTGFNVTFDKTQDARLTLNGFVQFFDGSKDWKDAITMTTGQTAGQVTTALGALVYPARIYRPFTPSFAADAGGGSIIPVHCDSLSLSMSGNVIADVGDNDISEVRDFTGFNELRVRITHRDAGKNATDVFDKNQKLMNLGRGTLVTFLNGRGQTTGKTLTVNGLLWVTPTRSNGPGYTEFSLEGAAGWRKDASNDYLLSGGSSTTQLFHIA